MAAINELSRTLTGWVRHLRTQRALTWSLRGLIIGLIFALTTGLIGLYRLDLLRNEFLVLVILSTLLTPLIASVIAYLWPVDSLRAARYFDRAFQLGERVSTALELGRKNESSDLVHQQLEDAVYAAQKIRPSRFLPLRLQKNELAGLFAVALLLTALWFRGEQWFKAAAQARAVQAAISEQTANIEEIIQEIESNQLLSEEQKQQLTEPLEQALNELQENPTLEGSVSALTNTAQKLENLSDEQSSQMSQALQQTGNQLSQEPGSPLQTAGENLAQGDNMAAASDVANLDVSQMSAAEKAELANQLNTMADALSSTNPQLANELQKAADALQNGDDAAAQQALNNAAQALAEASQQIASSQTASQASQQMQQGANQVMAAGGGQAQTQNGQGQGTAQGGQTNGTGAAGSGSGSEPGSPSSGGEAANSPIDQSNGPGDGGEAAYEQIYAPSLLGGENGSTVDLPSSGEGGDVIGQGPTDPSQPGQSLVPYNEVYAQYDEFNHEAIESGNIPLSFMDIIRNYFDSLEP